MAKPTIFTWPVQDLAAIAAIQSRVGAGVLVLNGTQVVTINGVAQFQNTRISRTVSFNSANNNAGITFSIVGTLDGGPQSENGIVGPGAGATVYSTKFYSTVTSITASNTATNVRVGTGLIGKTDWFQTNYNSEIANLAIQVNRVATTINYSFVTTLDDVQSFEYSALVTFTPITALTGATTSQLAGYTVPARFSNITVNSSNATGNLVATFLQQGVI